MLGFIATRLLSKKKRKNTKDKFSVTSSDSSSNVDGQTEEEDMNEMTDIEIYNFILNLIFLICAIILFVKCLKLRQINRPDPNTFYWNAQIVGEGFIAVCLPHFYVLYRSFECFKTSCINENNTESLEALNTLRKSLNENVYTQNPSNLPGKN